MASKAAAIDRFPLQESIRATDRALQQWATEQSEALIATQQNNAQSAKFNKGSVCSVSTDLFNFRNMALSGKIEGLKQNERALKDLISNQSQSNCRPCAF
jgi:hypothetical protein